MCIMLLRVPESDSTINTTSKARPVIGDFPIYYKMQDDQMGLVLDINTIKTSNGKFGSTLINICTLCVSKNLQFVCIQSIACQLIGFVFGFDIIYLLVFFFFLFSISFKILCHNEITVLPQSATRNHLHTRNYNMNMHSWKLRLHIIFFYNFSLYYRLNLDAINQLRHS